MSASILELIGGYRSLSLTFATPVVEVAVAVGVVVDEAIMVGVVGVAVVVVLATLRPK